MSERPLSQQHETLPNPLTPDNQPLSTSLNSSSIQLWLVLNHLELDSYFNRLLDNGFDNWMTVLDIREEDLEKLSFKLGHRRKLQREIAAYRNDQFLRGGGKESSSNISRPSAISSDPEETGYSASSTPSQTNREYQIITTPATTPLQDDKVRNKFYSN